MPTIGERLADRYRLDALIGSGGFAAVFRAHDLRLDRDVAVKVLLANHATDEIVAARFEREARVLAAINHPNVVAIHDVAAGGHEAGTEPFLVMELCDGGSLADLLAASRHGSFPADTLIPILIDTAAGLAALHGAGIVHRDLKPSNVLLSGGRARIADLGIAVAGPSDLTATGTTVGTLSYLAPEQLGGAPASPASDVHALGVIAFLGLTGRLPNPAESVAAVVAASARPADPVSALAPGLGTAFDRPIARALAPDPSLRPTAAELGTDLVAALEVWRTQPGPPLARLAPAVAGLDSAYDPTTLVDIPIVEESTAPTANAAQRQRQLGAIAALVAIVGLGALALLVAHGLGNGTSLPPASVFDTSPPSPSIATPTASAAPSAPPSLGPSPTPTPTPSVTVDPFAKARSASQMMRSAIAAARGPHGLKGKDANALAAQLDKFDQALDDQDSGEAQDTANKLAGQVADLVNHGDLDAQAAAALKAAASRLVAAANALPD